VGRTGGRTVRYEDKPVIDPNAAGSRDGISRGAARLVGTTESHRHSAQADLTRDTLQRLVRAIVRPTGLFGKKRLRLRSGASDRCLRYGLRLVGRGSLPRSDRLLPESATCRGHDRRLPLRMVIVESIDAESRQPVAVLRRPIGAMIPTRARRHSRSPRQAPILVAAELEESTPARVPPNEMVSPTAEVWLKSGCRHGGRRITPRV
jgi:hypothetical protein